MEKEIIFFENKDAEVGSKPPNHETNPACGTPNPPPWCEDPNHANIDMYLLILVVIAILIKVIIKKEYKTYEN